jgi:hypothetical protein
MLPREFFITSTIQGPPSATVKYTRVRAISTVSQGELFEMNEAERQARLDISPEVLREMQRGMGTVTMHDIAMRDARAPTGPSSQGIIPTSQTISNVHPGGGGAPINNTGWRTPTPIGPPPGVAAADRLMDADARRDFAESLKSLSREQLDELVQQEKAKQKELLAQREG